MSTAPIPDRRAPHEVGGQIHRVGREATHWGLVLVIAWIGAMKFTGYEAEGIRPFVEHSPLMTWTYEILSVRAFSALLGVAELVIAALLALGRLLPIAGVAGGAMGVCMFLTTLSFMLTTPGIFEPNLGGFPALSITGQFVLKDVVLLGASTIALGEALQRLGTPRG